jgi:deoxyadenosine/deoxycytidine kinase
LDLLVKILTVNSEFINQKNFQEKETKNGHLYIAVMGVTGAGKTTFAKYLSEKLDSQLLEEIPVRENPFFREYYGSPDTYLPAQIFFLDMKWRQICGDEVLKNPGIQKILKKQDVILEPPIYEDALYAQARLEEKPKEWNWYKEYYSGLIGVDSFPKPDLVVFLRLRLPAMLSRIAERAKKNPERESELNESAVYWERLRWLHESWVKENPLGLKIVTLDMDRFDFSSYKSDGDALEAAFVELRERSGGLIK